MGFDDYLIEQLTIAKRHGLKLSQAEKDQIVQDWLKHEKRQRDPMWKMKKEEAEDAWEAKWQPRHLVDGVWVNNGMAQENHDTRKSFDDWMARLEAEHG